MGIFEKYLGFDADVEKATSETNTNENWSLIMDVCDKVVSNPRNAKECLRAIMKRMNHNDPHVVMQAITLLNACASNCGKVFLLEIASREFENEFKRLLRKAQSEVSIKLRQVLKSWAEKEFKHDPELNLIPALYLKLRLEGYDFTNLQEKPQKSAADLAAAKDPNIVSSQQEEDDLAKAIELSLKEVKNSPENFATTTSTQSSAYPTLYPNVSNSKSSGATASSVSQAEPRKVRALYDFEAAEENELTFFAGEIVHVTDDSDTNWWKGYNQRGEGLFPSNFVSADLTIDPERLEINQHYKSQQKSEQFEEDTRELQQKTEAAAAAAAAQTIEIDENKIDRLLHLLHEANPEDPSQDTEEMLRLEQEVHQMNPLIDSELERVDRKHAQLSQLSIDLVDAINLYYSLMQEDRSAINNSPFMAGTMSPPPGMLLMNHPQYTSNPNVAMNLYGTTASYPNNFHPQAYQGGPSSLPHNSSAPSINSVHVAGGHGSQMPVSSATTYASMPYQNGQAATALTGLSPIHLNHYQLAGQQSALPPQAFQRMPQIYSNTSLHMNTTAPLPPHQTLSSSANQTTSESAINVGHPQVAEQNHFQQQAPGNPVLTAVNSQIPNTTAAGLPQVSAGAPAQLLMTHQTQPNSYLPNASTSVSLPPQAQTAATHVNNALAHQTNQIHNGPPPPPTSYMSALMANSTAAIPPMEQQFAQLQQQMANISMGQTATNAPPPTSYTTNLTSNMPIYQQ